MTETPTLYEWAGGTDAFVRLTESFYAQVTKDDAADEAGLPDDPEFRAAFLGYIEWGTRLARQNSQPGADVPRRAPVPRWGWGVAPPYLG
jgi:truncated hemoglobin YjbI